MVRLRLAQFGKEAPEKYWGPTTTLVFVEGYHGAMVRGEEEWLALELRDGPFLQWADTSDPNKDEPIHHIFKYPPPQRILVGIQTVLIGIGQVIWTDQSYSGPSSNRYLNHMIFNNETFERALFKYAHHIKEIPDYVIVTGKIDD